MIDPIFQLPLQILVWALVCWAILIILFDISSRGEKLKLEKELYKVKLEEAKQNNVSECISLHKEKNS